MEAEGRGPSPYLSKLLVGPGYSSPELGHRCSGWLCQNSILEREQGQLCDRELSTGLGWTHWAVRLELQPLYTGANPLEGGVRPGASDWLSTQGSRRLSTCQADQAGDGAAGMEKWCPMPQAPQQQLT